MKRLMLHFVLLLAALPGFSQEFALKQLESSPRHQEWVEVTYGGRQVKCFLVYPEVANKAMALIVIHENKGLTDWVRSMADQVAEMGYIAIAPDLLSGKGPNGGGTADFPSEDEARKAIYTLNSDQVLRDLDAVKAYAAALPACTGEVSVSGFCWGGSTTFRYATHQPEIKAALVFYGTGPDSASAYQAIKAPVYGFYGGNDARVNATIPFSEEAMKAAGKSYQPVVYPGAGHGFMRSGQDPAAKPDDAAGRKAALDRIRAVLEQVD